MHLPLILRNVPCQKPILAAHMMDPQEVKCYYGGGAN
jgi:hypothetical protein